MEVGYYQRATLLDAQTLRTWLAQHANSPRTFGVLTTMVSFLPFRHLSRLLSPVRSELVLEHAWGAED